MHRLLEAAAEGRVSDLHADAGLYREAMSRLVAAVHVVTTDGAEGRAGFTATAVVSVSDSPPTLLVCLNRRVTTAPRFHASGVFVVNMLAGGQEAVAQAFGGRLGLAADQRFGVGEWHRGRLGAPVLAGALANFECRMVEVRTIATHDVLVGRVESVTLGAAREGLAYVGRNYLIV